MAPLANVGIPSVAGHVFIMLVLLVPIALIEGIVLWKRHPLPFGQALGLSLRVNLWSTFVGLPLGYLFALLGIIPAGMFVALLPEGIQSAVVFYLLHALYLGGTLPARADVFGFFLGTLIVMIPYYLFTLYVERKCIARTRTDLDVPRLTGTVRIMNDITYGLLVIVVVVGAVRELMK